jgi:hypothetical protein
MRGGIGAAVLIHVSAGQKPSHFGRSCQLDRGTAEAGRTVRPGGLPIGSLVLDPFEWCRQALTDPGSLPEGPDWR